MAMAIAMMTLPFVSKTIESTLRNVPASYIEGSYVLGAEEWRTIHKKKLFFTGLFQRCGTENDRGAIAFIDIRLQFRKLRVRNRFLQ